MPTIEAHAARFKALGHPARLSILRQLVQGKEEGTPVGEILQVLGIPASTLSHHLAALSAADLVQVERRATTLLYRVHFPTLGQLTDFLWQDCCAGETAPLAARAPDPAPARPAWVPAFLDAGED
jgi:DNA-binding transcriptional ArsR family regulator